MVTFKAFTTSNTGLDKPYPEMGSAFKAAFMKAAMWFFTKTAIELANANPDDTDCDLEFWFRGSMVLARMLGDNCFQRGCHSNWGP